MINGRSHVTVMVLALVCDSITCRLRQAEGGSVIKRDGRVRRNDKDKKNSIYIVGFNILVQDTEGSSS